MNREEIYEFTGYYPSRNPFLWLYDDHRHSMFTTSLRTATWKKKPCFGDKIKFIDHNTEKEKIYVNNELVWEYSEAAAKANSKIHYENTLEVVAQKFGTDSQVYKNLKEEYEKE